MKKPRKTVHPKLDLEGRLDSAAFWLSLALLVLVPLVFSTSLYTKYSLPKFVVLLVGSAALLFLLMLRPTALAIMADARRSTFVKIVLLYLIVVILSSLLGVEPMVSLFGSHFNYMGLLTRLCFVVCFIALIVSIGASQARLQATLWAITATGFIVALYAVAQAFHIDPLTPRSVYTFASPAGPIIRVCATLGHSNYLGNFLLYTTPVSAAFAFTASGWRRWLAVVAIGLSLAAIGVSGTRGAWVGILVGIAVFAVLEAKRGASDWVSTRRRAVIAAVAIAVVVIVGGIIISPVSRSITSRVRSLMKEGAAASGRTLLWRDALKMAPSFAFVGCGPEGFRKAFLGFKSEELARLNPDGNNESSHNSYLDALLTYGLPGAALYLAMIIMALKLFLRARRHAPTPQGRILITGLTAAFVAVLAHNFFIFDQITTGFYFFAFVALAQVAANVFDDPSLTARLDQPAKPAPQNTKPSSSKSKPNTISPTQLGWMSRSLAAVAGLILIATIWYAAGLLKSDRAYKELFNPASPVDYNGLVKMGERVTSSPLPSRAYDYLFARAVDSFIRGLPAASKASAASRPMADEIAAIRANALQLGITHIERSLAHTITPDLNYLLLGSLAMAANDVNRLREAATEAVQWDPNGYAPHRLLAEAYLAQGDKEQAAREAEIAINLNPPSFDAASVLARARGASPLDDSAALEIKAKMRNLHAAPTHSVEDLLETARRLAQAGQLQKARVRLFNAVARAAGPCPDCHRELAILYEKMKRYKDAIAEWEIFITQAPERAATEQTPARIDTLKQQSPPRP